MKLSAAFLAVLCAPPAAAQDSPEKDFKASLQAQSETGLERACRAIVVAGQPEGAKLILSGLGRPNEEPIYWLLVRSAAAFQSSRALTLVSQYVADNKTKPAARDITMALHNNFSSAAEEAMTAILAAGTEELRVSALDHLMDIGKKGAVGAAVDLLQNPKEPAEVRKRCLRLLTKLTQLDYGDSVSNWTGWWTANKDKPWEQLRKGGGAVGTTTLGNSRQDDVDKMREAKVLIIRAGDKCKCKKNHDLDRNIDRALSSMPCSVESITKDRFENDKTADDAWLKHYIGVIAICTHIREHCACPDCKPGGTANMRLYQCTGCNKHDNTRFVMGKKGTAKIKRYVDAGGYLFTEDWALEEIIEPEWGDVLGHSKYLPEQEVAVLPKPGSGTHPYLRKIFVKPPTRKDTGGTSIEEDVSKLDHVWKIDADSPAISIKDRKRVTTLMFSETLGVQSEKEKGSDAVAVTFLSGSGAEPDPVASGRAIPQNPTVMKGGRVMHVLAHFGNQGSSAGGERGEHTLMNLLVNFLIEANERRPAVVVPRKGSDLNR